MAVGLNPTGRMTPWGGVPDLNQFYGGLWDLYQQGPTDPLSPEQQVAPLDPFQTSALDTAGGYGAPGGMGYNLAQNTAGNIGQGLDMDLATSYADNPYMDDMITAALRDPYRGLTEQTLPGIGLAGAAGGSPSSRTGLAEGVAQRGYADRASDVAANMRGGAYSQGLNLAAGDADRDIDLTQMANNLGLSNIDTMFSGGQGYQTQEQQLRNAQQGNWGYNVDRPWELASNYGGAVLPPATAFGTRQGVMPSITDVIQGGLAGGALNYLGGNLFEDDGWLDQFGGWLGNL